MPHDVQTGNSCPERGGTTSTGRAPAPPSALSRRVLLGATLALASARPVAAADPVTVFAAASLKGAIDEAGAAFRSRSGVDIRAVYAASSALVQQMEQGARADVFASADVHWMDYAERHGLVRPGTRVDLLGNTLVAVAPRSSPLAALAFTPAAFEAAVGDGHWMTGTVDSVPCGIYAKEALTHLGLWTAAAPKLAQTENVRVALAFVSRGEVPLGIVYETDARADPGVKVVATFPSDTHAPIVYPFALAAAAAGEAPARFFAFLRGEEAGSTFERQGFIRLAKP